MACLVHESLTVDFACPHDRFKMSPLYVDHNHDTDTVRALACGPCNSALGLSNDDPTTLRQMADYLERYAA